MVIQRMLFLLLVLAWGASCAEASIEQEYRDYRLGVGDHLQIDVFGEPDLTIEAEIGDLGKIIYPFIGEIPVKGMSVEGLQGFVRSKLEGDYLVDPVVTVKVIEYRRFYINGHVRSPGAYEFKPGLTVRKAVSLAGGFGERASTEKIYVVHGDRPEAEPQKIGLDERLEPGDVITVDRSFF